MTRILGKKELLAKIKRRDLSSLGGGGWAGRGRRVTAPSGWSTGGVEGGVRSHRGLALSLAPDKKIPCTRQALKAESPGFGECVGHR